MPGIIVSRPIFNTLFKLAHDEGLSINAFLTRLLETAGPDGVKQAVNGRVAQAEPASLPAAESGAEIAGSEREPGERSDTRVGQFPAAQQATERASYAGPTGFDSRAEQLDDEPQMAGVGVSETGERLPGRRIGDTIWDKVVSMEGRRFATSRGKKFSYKVTGEYIVVRDSQARIPRSQFDKAQKMWPVSGPSRLVGVYAPSVVWAVMKELNEAEAAAAV